MKIYFIISLCFSSFLLSSCYNQRPEIQYSTFEEALDPEAKNVEAWEATGRGLHLSFGSVNTKYRKGRVPMLTVVKDQSLQVWKGERASVQAVLWTVTDVDQVECVWSDFISSTGDTLSNDMVETSYVRYVMSDADFVNDQSDVKAWRDSCILPDMLDQLPTIDMDAQTVRPLWFTINVPSDAPAGNYKASLKTYSRKNPPQELRLTLTVLNKQLPAPKKWRFQTNMSINPFAIANWHQVEPWSNEHFEVLEPYVELLKKAGQKNITASVFNQGVSGETKPLIKWMRKKNGQVVGDFTTLDVWIKFFKHHDINSQIDCYAYRPEGVNTISIYNEQDGHLSLIDLSLKEHYSLIKSCYLQLINHLKETNEFGKAVFVIDSGNNEDVALIKGMIQSIDANIKLELVAHEWASGLFDDVYATNVPAQFSNLKEWFKFRHQQGFETTYHLSFENEIPNVFLHSPSAEAAWLGWYAAAQGLDGIHVEGLNTWGANPLTEARLSKYSSGSNYLIYPKARSSIRFELLIEGIQDFEKIQILKEEYLETESEINRKQLELIDELLSDFVIDRIPREDAAHMVDNGKALLKQLSQQSNLE
ncbi:DUF4091 domain-containing protein [Carboxylicivirga sp. M1479]|uniref:DUF4091 domain-containing protein n=1 Tax=Carboxylicivirga sp. M1479 TaxID=2594476 RepID=UPI00163D43E9|nr:DUF4091 domain-containing protein [Carboxylicivirga sp. M1479]